ncbi:hypothetical protein ACFFJT_07135 [Dyella flava]|uniref:Uncharacterized protein n=1 Tax=Dyella flava TaxID=1920170 RepID=A0ABS2K952_9GAMM|nr:hypothetical protein [Dyella flava]MBM7127363.1 hypothetical protein [Dyella flava]GLQ50960.1 hypothetical protein GCM10010872_24090 [Dyella flava]
MLEAAGIVSGLAFFKGGLCSMQKKVTNPEQRWRPLSLMPAFKFAVGRAAEGARVQAKSMRVAIKHPGLVNRFDLVRMRLVYEETALNAAMCREQVKRWRGECVTREQMMALDRLEGIVDQWSDDTDEVLEAIKALLHEH